MTLAHSMLLNVISYGITSSRCSPSSARDPTLAAGLLYCASFTFAEATLTDVLAEDVQSSKVQRAASTLQQGETISDQLSHWVILIDPV